MKTLTPTRRLLGIAVPCAVSILLAVALPLHADQFGDFTYTDQGTYIEVTDYTGSGGDVVIPATIVGKPVTSIGNQAFSWCSSLTSVSFESPSSVTSIGSWAFSDCWDLARVTIPSSVTSIGSWAFSNCWGLASVIFESPSSVTNIGVATFYDCISLTSVTIPSSVTSIWSQAFYDCSSLVSAIFAGDAPSMGTGVFAQTDPRFTVYYLTGGKGFDLPPWTGYTTVEIDPSATAGVVINTNDSGPGSLRQAIADASSGDTITFDASLSGQTIVLTSGQLTVDKDLNIDGSGLAGAITVDGNHASRILLFPSGHTSTLKSLRLIQGGPGKGPSELGGGISTDATLTVERCTLSGNTSSHGGGIANSGTLTLLNSTLSHNWTSDPPGVESFRLGGGVYNRGKLVVTNSILNGNSAVQGGGIYNTAAGTLTINNSMLSGNLAEVGGGICNAVWDPDLGPLKIHNTTLAGNLADWGGGIANQMGRLEARNSIFVANAAEEGGGIITFDADTQAHNCLFYSNTAPTDPDWSGPFQGTEILTTVPLFVAPDDYHLQPGSPCIDAGTAVDDILADIEGTPRPLDGNNDGIARIDIGAYEFVNPDADSDHDGLKDGMEKDTLGTNAANPNTDGDPRNDHAEWLADTDGTDPSDWFRITASGQGQWMEIRFHASQNRHYTLRRCEDLGTGVWTDVPGHTRIRGEGRLHTFFFQKPASPSCFWRVEPGIPSNPLPPDP